MTDKNINKDIPFSFIVKVGHVSSNPISVTLEADDKERAALAELWKVVDVISLKAEVKLSRWKRDGVRVSGHFHGELLQNCVVSLEPIETSFDEDFTSYFVPETSRLARQDDLQNGELVIDVDGPDMPDTFTANSIDIGEVVAEFAAMAIDPYPRDPKAVLDEDYETNALNDEKPPSPFAALQALKREME